MYNALYLFVFEKNDILVIHDHIYEVLLGETDEVAQY